jgi:hypothetical protein
MNDTGHWNILCSDFSSDCFGFVYCITSKLTGKKYIGKKQLSKKVKRKPLKGNVNRRISTAESDWKMYTGSSKELNDDIVVHGHDNFTFEILEMVSCKWEASYCELKHQIHNNVLLDDSYYNGIINVRIGKVPKHLREKYNSTP